MAFFKPTFVDIVGYIFKFIIVAFVIIFTLTMIPDPAIGSIDKIGIEMGENILNSPLTVNRAIFDESELAMFDGTISEPYVRYCRQAYKLTIECIHKDLCTNNGAQEKYEFGFDGTFSGDAIEKHFLVSIKSGDAILPARMTLMITQSKPITKLGCIVEKAYKLKTVQEDKIDIKAEVKTSISGDIIKPKTVSIVGDKICIALSGSSDCKEERYLKSGVRLRTFDPTYTFFASATGGLKTHNRFKALPAREDRADALMNLIKINDYLCVEEAVYTPYLAGSSDEVEVVLCAMD